MEDRGTMWALSAAFFVVALVFGSAGMLAAMRRRSQA
jgi:hypothetical protein